MTRITPWVISVGAAALFLGAGVGAVPARPQSADRLTDPREALLRQVAQAWSGTPYKNHGKTFDGIGNAEFVREVYAAAYDADLPADSGRWQTLGVEIDRRKLEPGDVIFYDADPLTHFRKDLHAGVYIGNGQFVAAVKGEAVAVLKLSESRWKSAYQTARRIEPAPGNASAARSTPSSPANRAVNEDASPVAGAIESRLRDVEREWHGTPYRLGGTSKSGIDCSAFSRLLYAEVYHMDLPRTVEEQETVGKSVSRSRLRAGDLVFFRSQAMGPRSSSRHVGVYLGHNEFAQASGSRGVTISKLDDPYWNERYRTARRVAQPK